MTSERKGGRQLDPPLTDKEAEALAKSEATMRERIAKHETWIAKAKLEHVEVVKAIGLSRVARHLGVTKGAMKFRLLNLEGRRKR
jgi:hypothetical protein